MKKSKFAAMVIVAGLLVISGCGNERRTVIAGTGGVSNTVATGENTQDATLLAQILVPYDKRAEEYTQKVLDQITELSQKCSESASNPEAVAACGSPEAQKSHMTKDQLEFAAVSESLRSLLTKTRVQTAEGKVWFRCVSEVSPGLPGLTPENAEKKVSEAVVSGKISESSALACVNKAFGGPEQMLDQQRTIARGFITRPDAQRLIELAQLVGY